jgi:hypothetical protein
MPMDIYEVLVFSTFRNVNVKNKMWEECGSRV